MKTNTDPVEVIDKANLGKRIIIIDKDGNASKRGRSQFPLDEVRIHIFVLSSGHRRCK